MKDGEMNNGVFLTFDLVFNNFKKYVAF